MNVKRRVSMIASFFGLAGLLVAAACGGSDEAAAAPLCDPAAFGLARLQPGTMGGPDTHARVSCSPGFLLCRVDVQYLKSTSNGGRTCADANDCYACSSPTAGSLGMPCLSVTDCPGNDPNTCTDQARESCAYLCEVLPDSKDSSKGICSDNPR